MLCDLHLFGFVYEMQLSIMWVLQLFKIMWHGGTAVVQELKGNGAVLGLQVVAVAMAVERLRGYILYIVYII